MGIDNLAEQAGEALVKKTPYVFGALGKMKLFILGIPLLFTLLGVGAQVVMEERDVVVLSFKVGSVINPGNSAEVIPLAEERQMLARLRHNAWQIKDDFQGFELVKIT